MDNKTNKIKPITLILLLAGLAPSLWLAFAVIKGKYLSNMILYILLGVLAVINIICLFIGLKAKHKWFMFILTLLLIVISAAGIYADKMIGQAIDYADRIFTEVPETTDHSIYLLNHTYYMIIDEIDDKEIEIGFLDHFNTADVNPAIKGINDRNATLDIKNVYKDPYSLFSDWNRFTKNNVTHIVMSTILPDELVELSGEIFNTEVFLSTLKIKYTYTEEISTGLNNEEKADITKQPFTVLIGGNDARGIKTDEDFMNRSDTNFLLTVNPNTRKIILTTLPLDLMVNIDGHQDRLTDASFFGIECWEKCAEELLGINIDYFARFNYSKIAELIDAYGGIQVTNPYGFRTFRDIRTEDGWYDPAWYFDSGELELTGDKALVYLRELRHLANGHDARWNNIKRVFTGLWEKLTPVINDISFRSQDSITDTIAAYKENLQKCRNLIDQIEKSVATDIDTQQLLRFIIKDRLTSSEKWSFEIIELSADYNKYPCYSANDYEMFNGVIYEEELQSALQKIHAVLDN